MRLQIVGIENRGMAQLERLHLSVISQTSLSYIMVVATNYVSPNGLVWGGRQTFWFPNVIVATGDHVYLYSRGASITDVPPPKNMHFFYWGQPRTLWNAPEDCAVLFEINSWQTSPYGS